MFALWHASERPGKISSLVAIGDPGAALPGVQVKMPLSVLTVPGLGRAVLATPTPRSTYKHMLGQGTSPAALRSMPDELVDVLHLACRRRGNPKTVASLMHAIDGFRHPRPETLMSDGELARIQTPTLFYWGREDPFLSPQQRAGPSLRSLVHTCTRSTEGMLLGSRTKPTAPSLSTSTSGGRVDWPIPARLRRHWALGRQSKTIPRLSCRTIRDAAISPTAEPCVQMA